MSANFDEILKLLQQYSKEELQSIFDIAMDAARPDSSKPARGKCPYCKSEHIIYFGFKNGKQRFRCKECKRTFITTTNTVMSCSHYGIDVWESMLEHTLKGYSLPFSEKELGLSHQAAFNMRHKLLLAMQDNREENPCILSDVSELDETFVLDCYKGHKLPETVTRPARKHGAKAQKRGISNEYICICTGVAVQEYLAAVPWPLSDPLQQSQAVF